MDELVTELRVENGGPRAAEANLTFLPAEGVAPAPLRLSLGGRERVEILDLFARWPAAAGGSGVLLIETGDGTAGFRATARTYSRRIAFPARVSPRRVGPALARAEAVGEAGRGVYFPLVARNLDDARRFVTFDLSVTNPGSGDVKVRLTFLQDGRDNSPSIPLLLRLEPGETRVLEDVPHASFGLAGVSGYLKVESASPVRATGRLVVREQGGPELAARTVLPIRPERFSTFSSLSWTGPGELGDSIGLLNPGGSAEPVVLRIWTEARELMNEASVLVPARGSLEVNLATLFSIDARQKARDSFLTIESLRPHFSFSF